MLIIRILIKISYLTWIALYLVGLVRTLYTGGLHEFQQVMENISNLMLSVNVNCEQHPAKLCDRDNMTLQQWQYVLQQWAPPLQYVSNGKTDVFFCWNVKFSSSPSWSDATALQFHQSQSSWKASDAFLEKFFGAHKTQAQHHLYCLHRALKVTFKSKICLPKFAKTFDTFSLQKYKKTNRQIILFLHRRRRPELIQLRLVFHTIRRSQCDIVIRRIGLAVLYICQREQN